MTVYVYVVGPYGGPYKIGITSDVTRRLIALQVASPARLQLIAKKAYPDRSAAQKAEKAFHEALSEHSMTGEWFSADLDIVKAVVQADEHYEVRDAHTETREWFRQNMRQMSEFARGNLAKLYGLDTLDPDKLADFRAAQVIAGNV